MLEHQATPARLRHLAEIGVLDGALLGRALERLDARGDRRAWRLFAERALLFVGLALGVAAVIFFFAANWGVLSRGARLGLALFAHVGAALIAVRIGTEHVAGRAAAAGAALLIGPALLTYGQAYQTGADAWQLFAAWTVLAVPFAVVVRGTAVWAVVLVLARVAAFLHGDQSGNAYEAERYLPAAVAVLLLDIVALGLVRGGRVAVLALRRPHAPFERPLRQPVNEPSLLPVVVTVLGLVTLAPTLILVIAGPADAGAAGAALAIGAVLAHVLGMRDAIRAGDLPRVAVVALSVALHLGCIAARVVFDGLDLDELGFLFMTVFVLAEGSLIARLLRDVHAGARGETA